MNDELLESYNYNLPQELIANEPIMPKSSAKLLVYRRDTDTIIHSSFGDFFSFIPKDSLIVLNDTKVIKARIFGNKTSGGKIELLYHNALDDHYFKVQIKGRVKIGDEILLPDNAKVIIKDCLDNGIRIVEFYKDNKIADKNIVLQMLNKFGCMPLPPYIKRKSSVGDEMAYQSVFAQNLGAIAAPTASLHFSDEDLQKIKLLNHCFVTLHIGAGTFFNIETDNIKDHKMHSEAFFISQDSKYKIDNSDNVLCIGTTACRCVEYYARSKQTSGDCDIFLNPFNKPIKTKYLLTNFHLPKSSLIMLVSAFIGIQKTLEIYQDAIKNKYRFYSYGDGMLIL